MDYQAALEACSKYSAEHQCSAHVSARIKPESQTDNGLPQIDPNGYTVTDWHDGTCVARFNNGWRAE